MQCSDMLSLHCQATSLPGNVAIKEKSILFNLGQVLRDSSVPHNTSVEVTVLM